MIQLGLSVAQTQLDIAQCYQCGTTVIITFIIIDACCWSSQTWLLVDDYYKSHRDSIDWKSPIDGQNLLFQLIDSLKLYASPTAKYTYFCPLKSIVLSESAVFLVLHIFLSLFLPFSLFYLSRFLLLEFDFYWLNFCSSPSELASDSSNKLDQTFFKTSRQSRFQFTLINPASSGLECKQQWQQQHKHFLCAFQWFSCIKLQLCLFVCLFVCLEARASFKRGGEEKRILRFHRSQWQSVKVAILNEHALPQ